MGIQAGEVRYEILLKGGTVIDPQNERERKTRYCDLEWKSRRGRGIHFCVRRSKGDRCHRTVCDTGSG